MTPVSVVIPAAGEGRRMGAPKQFLRHGGKSLLRWSVEPLLCLGERLRRVVVVLPPGEAEAGGELRDALGDRLLLATGGPTRQHSVLNGLEALAARDGVEGVWLVHDAARPLLQPADLENLVTMIESRGCGALLAQPVRDTLKREAGAGLVAATVDRRGLWQAQTPQGGPAGLLLEASRRALREGIPVTDDAGILEAAGIPVALVEASPRNFKVTSREDWELFKVLAGDAGA